MMNATASRLKPKTISWADRPLPAAQSPQAYPDRLTGKVVIGLGRKRWAMSRAAALRLMAELGWASTEALLDSPAA